MTKKCGKKFKFLVTPGHPLVSFPAKQGSLLSVEKEREGGDEGGEEMGNPCTLHVFVFLSVSALCNLGTNAFP